MGQGGVSNSHRARQHAKHAYFCSCGKVVHGNGGKAGHGYMHEQRRDGHRFIGRRLHEEKFPEQYVYEPLPLPDGKASREA